MSRLLVASFLYRIYFFTQNYVSYIKMYVTLKLNDSGCKIHSISDGNEEIVTNERYMVMPWKMVTRRGINVTLKQAVEEIEKEGEERRLVFEFETKHRDEILEILGLIDYIDKGYIKERFPEVYKFDCERLGIHFEDKFVLKSIALVTQSNEGMINSIISRS